MFSAAKDALTSQMARSYLNAVIKRYGEVRELKIDSRAKSVELVCSLIGEGEELSIRIDEYRLGTKDSKSYIEIVACTCSREWLQNVLEDHAFQRRFDLPAAVAAIL